MTAVREVTLVLSWADLLRAMIRGLTTAADLEGALYYLECSREKALNQASESCPELRRIMSEAEAEGRVVWQEPGQLYSFSGLNAWLEKRGLPTFPARRQGGGTRASDDTGLDVRTVPWLIWYYGLPYAQVPLPSPL